MTRSPIPLFAPVMLPGELTADYRTRLAMEQGESVERRRKEIAEQSSAASTPGERIRRWEKLHALTLPVEQNHPLLDLIATATNLSLEQLGEEQQQRSTESAAKSAPAKRKFHDPYCILSMRKLP